MSEPTIYLRCNRTQRLYQVVGATPTPTEENPDAMVLTIKGPNGAFTEPMRTVAEFEEIGYTRIIGDPSG